MCKALRTCSDLPCLSVFALARVAVSSTSLTTTAQIVTQEHWAEGVSRLKAQLRHGADIEDGAALREARRRKERTYPELSVWWSSLVKSGAGSLMRPKRSCGRWLAPRRRQCRDRCAPVPLLLGAGGGHACLLFSEGGGLKKGSPGAGDQVPSVNDVEVDARFLV